MERLWRAVANAIIRGKTDYRRNDRLNALLPPDRSAAAVVVRERARDEIRGFTQFTAGGGFAAIASLVGLAKLLDPTDRAALYQAAICFAVMGIGAVASLLLGIAEPLTRANVAHRLEASDEPMTDYEDYQFSEAVNDRLWIAPRVLRNLLIWRSVAALKTITLFAAAFAFCLGLALTAGALR